MRTTIFRIGVLMLGMAFTSSCALMGPRKLSVDCAEIVDGVTTGEQIVRLLGSAEHKIQMDSAQLEEYLEELTLDKSDYPKGQYEVWKYIDWRHPAYSKTDFTWHETLCSCVVVIDDRDVVVKKIYSEIEIMCLTVCKATNKESDERTQWGCMDNIRASYEISNS